MKDKHIQIRIRQCLVLAEASHCPRRKLAAMLVDPTRNVVLADGYNGGPRGAEGTLCKGHYCERDGLTHDDLQLKEAGRGYGQDHRRGWEVRTRLGRLQFIDSNPILDKLTDHDMPPSKVRAIEHMSKLVRDNPPIESGTRMERGCHHAEMNVVCNAAAGGVSCRGAWLIVLAEPCLMCAKMIHHAGIERVIVVDGGYLGGKAGVKYLRANGVQVKEIEGPRDPRIAGALPPDLHQGTVSPGPPDQDSSELGVQGGLHPGRGLGTESPKDPS